MLKKNNAVEQSSFPYTSCNSEKPPVALWLRLDDGRCGTGNGSPISGLAARVSGIVFGHSDQSDLCNGGSSGALYRNDFIELFNRGNTPIDVAGWSVQYAVGNGAQTAPGP